VTSSDETADAQSLTGRRIALAVAIVLAIVVRVLFLDAKPFWRDEAWVAMLVDEPSRAIADGRAVPFGFLWLVRMTRALVPAPPEVSYRIIPLLVGIAFVPLLSRAAKTFGARPWVGVLAAWFAAGLLPLIYYSRELKSYDIDLFVALACPMLAVAGFDGSAPKRGARIALMVLVIVAPWVSYACIFPIAALLAWGWLAWALRATPELRRDLFLCSAAFTASFAAAYFLTISSQVASPRLLSYWTPYLLGGGPSLGSRIVKGVTEYFRASTMYFFSSQWKVLVPIAALGALTWPRAQRSFLLWMYFAAAALCIVAALTNHYLIAHGRHLLFALPPLLLWAGQGLWTLARPLGPRFRPAALAVVAAFALYSGYDSVRTRIVPYHTNRMEFFRRDVLQDVDQAIAALEPLVAPDDRVILSLRTAYAFQFYRHGRLPRAMYCERACPDWDRRARDWLAVVPGRAWLILADEEAKSMKDFFLLTTFTAEERIVLRGVSIWELHEDRPLAEIAERRRLIDEERMKRALKELSPSARAAYKERASRKESNAPDYGRANRKVERRAKKNAARQP